MKIAVALSKENLEMSKDELTTLFGAARHYSNWSIVECDPNQLERLAYAKLGMELLLVCKKDDLQEEIKKIDWNCDGSIAVRTMGGCNLSSKEAATIIHRQIPKAPVDLDNPKSEILLAQADNVVLVGIKVYENQSDILLRKAHLRPELSPVSLNPRLARALVNLTGAKPGDTLIDPFCGTGGILIEAAMLGIECTGIDIDAIMTRKCQINLAHFQLNAQIVEGDALEVVSKHDHMVTDLPYGKSSVLSKGLSELYLSFLEKSYDYVIGDSVVCFPDFIDYKKFLGKWKRKKCYTYYLHKSLSKKIVVLSH